MPRLLLHVFLHLFLHTYRPHHPHQGNYECSPSSMIAVINECCAMKRAAALERTDTRAGAAGAGAGATGGGGAGADADSALAQPVGLGGAAGGAGGGGGASTGGGAVFIMNGFHLHRNKSQYGPAQQVRQGGGGGGGYAGVAHTISPVRHTRHEDTRQQVVCLGAKKPGVKVWGPERGDWLSSIYTV